MCMSQQCGVPAAYVSEETVRPCVGVCSFAGSSLVITEEDAVSKAEATGFPVLLKATGGGGGIGIYKCPDSAAVCANFAAAQR